ncbi:MAG TPA: protein translocase subunit SecF [Acidimicrobiia bacterium]|nr:protein translocase subunit SecF [Acidimicrobiia bacterium]
MTDTLEAPAPPKRRRTTFADLYHERTNFQFIRRSWRWALLSGSFILISIIALAISGLNLGIDFTGGLSYTVTVKGPVPTVNQVRSVLGPVGESDAQISLQVNRSTGVHSIVVQTPSVSTAQKDKIAAALARYGPESGVVDVSPTWGSTVTSKALLALGVFFLLIAAYLTFRFEWRMALAAILAVIHDILVTVGVYAVTGFQVVPATVIAFLTILGFSLYDTVVVFDKVLENTPRVGSDDYPDYSSMANRSLNAVLMRSLNTSFVAVLPVASLVFVGSGIFGATSLKDFALALFVGLTTGAYSSIFVATPILAWLKEREPKYRAVRERSQQQASRRQRDELAPATVGAAVPSAPAPVATPAAPAGDGPSARPPAPGPAPRPTGVPRPVGRPSGVTPRPRQQRRRKRR